MTPTLTRQSNNPFDILSDDDDEIDLTTNDAAHKQAMQLPNTVAMTMSEAPQQHPHTTTRCNSALSDSGATSHFLVEGAHAINIKMDNDPITITLPDGRAIQSTHTCNLDIPWLRSEATQAHIVPGLAHASLVSTAKFCDAGYTVAFDALECRIFNGTEIVLKGGRDKVTNLWRLPLRPNAKPTPHTAAHLVAYNRPVTDNLNTNGSHTINNVHTIPHLQNRVKYMHQVLFCPPLQTLLRAANLGFLSNLPFMTPDLIHKHLQKSPATAKGRLKLRPTGHQSTRRQQAPSTQANNTAIFCYAALADKQKGTFYTDCTGNLPARALDGQQLFFVAYAYDPNYIFAVPINSTSNSDIIAAFKHVFKTLADKGYKPTFNVTDNQAAEPIKAFMQEQHGTVQFVEPNNHRVNAAERAIQTFKNHFISGLCTTDKAFPFQLWNHLTEQANITCNILRRSRINPDISAYEQLHGSKYDWNAHPLAPPGTRAVIHSSTLTRTSWSPRGVDAWYCGPALDHYRCHHFYVPETRALRISGSFELYPTHCALPTYTPTEHIAQVSKELIRCMETLPKATRRRLLTTIISAIQKVTGNPPTDTPTHDPTTLPWPASKGEPAVLTTSTNPTAPHLMRTMPRIHFKHTRHNTPPTVLPTPDTPTQGPTSLPPTNEPTTNPSPIALLPPTTAAPAPHTEVRRSQRIALQTPRLYSHAALSILRVQTLTPQSNNHAIPWTCEHFCAPVIHPVTGESITNYKKLARDPATQQTWTKAFGKEFGNLAQGDNNTNTPGTDSIFVLTHEEIQRIPHDRTITYARIVVDYRTQKKDPNRVRLTAGGNLIDYPGELTTRTADLTTTKMLWNSVISTTDARYLCLDIKNFYLGTPMDRFEYMKMPLDIFPAATVAQYNLSERAYNGFVYLEIRKAIYGLPQAGILANKLLRQRLRPAGYYEVAHTPGLWKHTTRPVQFTLTVDDFGVKYVGKHNADHLIAALRAHYEVEEDWTGSIYCGISLHWDYVHRHVDISMPGYVDKLLARFEHTPPKRPQNSPHAAPPRLFGHAAQDPIEHDPKPVLPPDRIKRIQQIIGTIMYYARAVDITTLVALSSIATKQTKATENTENRVTQLLDYLYTHKDATIRYVASDMILNIHSDASYLSEPHARSRLGGHFFMGCLPVEGQPIQLNGPILVAASICKFVVASAAEAELGALFYNCQDGTILRLTLEELGHKQPPTPVHCDNSTAVSIANDTVKRQRSRAMEKNFFWTTDQVAIGNFNVTWHPGQENLADYFTKHFDTRHHQLVRPYYLHMHNSPTTLPRALAPRTLKGCVGTLPNGYARSAPLPRLQTDSSRTYQRRTTVAASHPSIKAETHQNAHGPFALGAGKAIRA